MSPEWKNAIDSFIAIFANLDFKDGPLFYVVGIIIAGYCCMEGYKIYKMMLSGLGFIFGFRVAYLLFGNLGWNNEMLLMTEVFLGLVIGTVTYKIYLAGVFVAVLQFGLVNFPVYVEAYLGNRLNFGKALNGIIITVASAVLAVVVAKLAVGMNRTVIVCLTAVIGGFAMVNMFVNLIPVFPYEVSMPEPSSVIWLGAKVFLSMAGAGIQGTKDSA